MNDFDAVARLRAWSVGRPLPIGKTVPWTRTDAASTLVVAFVRMAGETSPWAIAWGSPGQTPQVSSVPDPRRADDVRTMVMRFGRDLLARCGHPAHGRELDVSRAAIVLPGASHVEMLHYLEYRYARARKVPDGERDAVNAFGRLCGWTFRESQRPAQTLVVDVTKSLREAWALPAEDLRQQHLGFALAWLTAAGDRDRRAHAAERAEREAVGITLDPTVEAKDLEPYVAAWNDARKAKRDDVASAAKIRAVVEAEVRRRWALAVTGWSFLQRDGRPTTPAFADLAALTQSEYQWHWRASEAKRLAGEDPFVPDPETDRLGSAAASRFFTHQYCAEMGDTALLHGDPERVGRAVLAGEALLGTITQVRDEGVGRATVPVWTVETRADVPTRFREGSSVEVAHAPGRTGKLRDVAVRGAVRVLDVEITGQKTARGGFVHAADPALVGAAVAFVGGNMADLTRQKSSSVWNADGPGAWLTHGQSNPPQDRVTRRQDDLVDFVEGLGGSR
jgi:hypothetical protein